MDIPNNICELAKLFEKFGAPNPELWARSQVIEGFPQMQRYLFLRQAWRCVLEERDVMWIEHQVQASERNPSGPYASVGKALKRSLEKGATHQDLTEIARGLQAELLFQLCYLLDDPGFAERELQKFGWGLFQVDSDDNPISPRIGNLHESVLETDPTGREMRPKNGLDI